MKECSIYNEDARNRIKKIKDGSIDLIFTDPPYNLSPYSTGNMKFKWRKDINNDLAEWDKTSFVPSEWVKEFKRILKPTGNIFAFCSYNLVGKWHEAFDPEFDTFQFMVWHKTNPVPKFRKAGFLNSCELMVCMWNKKHTWNFGKQNEMHNYIEAPICMGNERSKNPVHPTQKPLRVLKHVIKIASQPNDIVLDPFMGVGSTGVASLELGRRFIGIEIDKKYFKEAERRLIESDSKMRLFVGEKIVAPKSKKMTSKEYKKLMKGFDWDIDPKTLPPVNFSSFPPMSEGGNLGLSKEEIRRLCIEAEEKASGLKLL